MKIHLPAQPSPAQSWKESKRPPSSLCHNPIAPSGGAIAGEAFAPPPRPVGARWARLAWLWSCLIFFSVVSYCLCNQFIVTSVVVQGKSMLPTLREGDHFLLDRWTYRHRDPERGDLVVLRDPGHTDLAVKRIIGLPGEAIFLAHGKVYVNNQELFEPYLPRHTRTLLPDGKDKLIILGKDQYYVLGDNRPVSEDSRYYGPIARQQITGNIAIR